MIISRALVIAALSATVSAGCTQAVQGLTDADIELVDIAPEGVATQSSTSGPYTADQAIDRNPDTFSHTLSGQAPARWELTLREPRPIRRVTIVSRRTCCRARNRDLNVVVLGRAERGEVFNYAAITGRLLNPGNELAGPERLTVDLWEVAGNVPRGVVLRIERTPDMTNVGYDGDLHDNLETLNLAEVEVWVPRL